MLNSITASGITAGSLIICLITALALGILTAAVFSWKNKSSASFSLTLALIPMVVAMIIMLVNGSIGTGVAIAGAFTLVRFRSVPGTAREISAIFVDVALGLAAGLGYVFVAMVFFLFAAVITVALTAAGFGGGTEKIKEVRITIPENLDYNGLFDEVFDKYTLSSRLVKVKSTDMGMLIDLTYEVEIKDSDIPKAFIDDIRTRNGNLNVIIAEKVERNVL